MEKYIDDVNWKLQSNIDALSIKRKLPGIMGGQSVKMHEREKEGGRVR